MQVLHGDFPESKSLIKWELHKITFILQYGRKQQDSYKWKILDHNLIVDAA